MNRYDSTGVPTYDFIFGRNAPEDSNGFLQQGAETGAHIRVALAADPALPARPGTCSSARSRWGSG